MTGVDGEDGPTLRSHWPQNPISHSIMHVVLKSQGADVVTTVLRFVIFEQGLCARFYLLIDTSVTSRFLDG
jgi:hypothetical protein